MRIMARNAGFRTRLDTLMSSNKLISFLFMTFRAELTNRRADQGSTIRAVSIVAGRAVLCRWLMQGAIPPVFSNLSMTFEA
jgi:hypothetical protein